MCKTAGIVGARSGRKATTLKERFIYWFFIFGLFSLWIGSRFGVVTLSNHIGFVRFVTILAVFSALLASAGNKLLSQLFLLHSCLRRSRGADVGAAELSLQSSSVVILPLPVDERNTTFHEVVVRLFRI